MIYLIVGIKIVTVFDQNVNWITHTKGDGYWSNKSCAVKILRVELAYVDDEGEFGELRAYFDRSTWDCNTDGLIYTDSMWINEFRALMRSLGFTRNAVNDISYSEQGMQGDSFVSMDVGTDFMREVEPMHRFIINKVPVNA
jgi:hypothetical protein